MESRLAPSATAQFSIGSETVNQTAGTFSIPVTLSGAPAEATRTFASGFTAPEGLAFDAAGNLYIANGSAGTVSKVTPAGVVSTFVSGFDNPTGLAFDAAGNLYVSTNAGFNVVSPVSKVTPGGWSAPSSPSTPPLPWPSTRPETSTSPTTRPTR